MALIKSALELALENTADIQGDREAIKRKELEEKGRRIASKYLFDPEAEGEMLQKSLKEVAKEERKTVYPAALEVFLSNITLPREEVNQELLKKVGIGLVAVTGEKRKIPQIIEQLGQFLAQYMQNRDQIIETLKEQYRPQLQAKEKALARQYGRPIELQPEQDPEFMQHLNNNLEHLDRQYQNALTQAKNDFRGML